MPRHIRFMWTGKTWNASRICMLPLHKDHNTLYSIPILVFAVQGWRQRGLLRGWHWAESWRLWHLKGRHKRGPFIPTPAGRPCTLWPLGAGLIKARIDSCNQQEMVLAQGHMNIIYLFAALGTEPRGPALSYILNLLFFSVGPAKSLSYPGWVSICSCLASAYQSAGI